VAITTPDAWPSAVSVITRGRRALLDGRDLHTFALQLTAKRARGRLHRSRGRPAVRERQVAGEKRPRDSTSARELRRRDR
jgi:hypothetical protein